ncbi:MAG: radical SAM protein [Deltaproteobacteria bacterium]|nr:radical SAM protein [Deltaproteobacteria bacterium]
MNYPRVDLSKYIVISIWFGCNNHCTICMLSDMKRDLAPIGFDSFRKVLLDIRAHGEFENLILSGAEVTTFEELNRYVRFAASLGCFRKIQIQTNGRRLKERGYLDHLIDCGVNEFFVSIHGPEEVHDAVTRNRGSFTETLEGLRNLEAYDVNVITNTVLTGFNYPHIPRLMAFLSRERISEIHLWNYYPMEKTDSRDFVVGMRDFVRLLPELLDMARQTRKALVLKSFPECLSRGEPGFFDSLYPVTILPDRFWREFSECGFGTCVHRGPCQNRQCWGLSSAYIQKYGDERELLSPMLAS